MKNRLFLGLLPLAMLAWFDASPVRADLVPFSYAWTVSTQVIGDPQGVNVQFTPSSASGTASAVLGSSLWTTFPGMDWRSSGPPGAAPLSLDAHVKFVLTLTDQDSGQVGHFDIDGILHGLVGSDFHAFGLLLAPNDSNTIQLGQHVYHFFPEIPPEPATVDGPGFGSLISQITITSASQAPEPSGLALGATVLSLAVCRWWHRHFYT